jgi:hypothetical protein
MRHTTSTSETLKLHTTSDEFYNTGIRPPTPYFKFPPAINKHVAGEQSFAAGATLVQQTFCRKNDIWQ